MEMQVRSSIQELVLAARAAVTDQLAREVQHEEYFKRYPHEVDELYGIYAMHADMRGIDEPRFRKLILGCGYYSSVVAHPTDADKVIKVWLNGADGSWTYLNKCWQVQETTDHQEWMPYVYELGNCMGKPYAIMEKLSPKEIPWAAIEVAETKFEEYFGFEPDDIHTLNLMWRVSLAVDGAPKKTLVITDPVTEWQ